MEPNALVWTQSPPWEPLENSPMLRPSGVQLFSPKTPRGTGPGTQEVTSECLFKLMVAKLRSFQLGFFFFLLKVIFSYCIHRHKEECLGNCYKTFSLITVYISQRDTILECRRSESLKQNRIKYGTVLPPSLVFRRAKQNHSSSVSAKGFQCDL